MIDFTFSPKQLDWQARARAFAVAHIAPELELLELNLERRKELFTLMGKEGYFALALPQPTEGVDTIAYLMALKEIARIDAGIAVAMTVTNMVASTIEKHGSDLQRDKYLPGMRDGSGVPAAFAVTEKNAGSDVKGIEMCATACTDPSGYILEGEKKFITNADIASVIIVIAKTGPGNSNFSAFLLDSHTPGFTISKWERKLGLLTANLVGMRCERCWLAAGQLLGQEGDGLKIALSALDAGRLGVAAQALGIAEAAFHAAISFSLQRKQFGSAIAEQQTLAFKLADMQVQLSACELLLLKAAWRSDQGLPYTQEASVAKLYCSEAANRIADACLQIHGGCGYTKDYPAEKYFRDARVTTLYEGTSEIQRLVIARHLLKNFRG